MLNGCHDIAKILIKLALNTNQSIDNDKWIKVGDKICSYLNQKKINGKKNNTENILKIVRYTCYLG
jgi:hypothetical protein